MSLKQEIQQELRDTLKTKEDLHSSTLRLLLASIFGREKEKKFKMGIDEELSDEEVIEAVISEIKKRNEAIPNYEKAGRSDLVKKEKKELEFLEKYLPEQLSDEEVRKLAKEAVEKTGASSIKDMGKVMAELKPQIQGKADGNLVSKIVKELLGL